MKNVVMMAVVMVMLSYSLSVAGWTYDTATNKMTDKKTSMASTEPTVGSDNRVSILFVKNFHEGGYDIGMLFDYLNLANTKSNLAYIKIRWDKEEATSLRVYVDNKVLYLLDNDRAAFVENLKTHSKLMVALEYFGKNSTTYYEYDLNGSTKAIEKALF